MMRGYRRTFVWLYMLTKRYLKNPLFLITILMIPILVLILGLFTGEDEGVIRTALYIEETEDNALAVQTVEALKNNGGTAITFYEVDSEEKIRQDVKSGYAMCGYVFPRQFENAVNNYVEGNRGELPFSPAIVRCIRKEETNFSKIAEEMVFSSFYETFSHAVLLDFMEKNQDGNGMEAEKVELLEEFYHSYDIQAELFRFEYMDGSENTLLAEESTSFLLLPVRGMIFILILLAAMSGGIVLYQDKECGVFQSIAMRRRGIIHYIYILIPTILAGAVGLLGIWFSGTYTEAARELPVMALYIFLVTGMCNILRRIFREFTWFVSFIPIFLIMNMILCPVFLDLSGIIPQIGYVQMVLPVSYGMNSLYDFSTRYHMGMIAAVLFLGIIGDK